MNGPLGSIVLVSFLYNIFRKKSSSIDCVEPGLTGLLNDLWLS